MEIKSLKDYDDELFFIFKSAFSMKFQGKFKNEKLYNSWGRKCNFIIKILKNVIYTKKNDIPKIINILIEFLSNKESSDELQYLSSFDYNVYIKHTQEMLTFRNGISSYLFTEIILLYDSNTGEIMKRLRDSINLYLEEYVFLKNLFALLQYSLDSTANTYEEFMLLLNNNNIIEKIIKNKQCVLNNKQIAFLQQQKLDLDNCDNLLKELKKMTLTNEELLADILSSKSQKSKSNKKKNKKMQIMNSNQAPSKNINGNLSPDKKVEDSNPANIKDIKDNSLTIQLGIEQNKDKEKEKERNIIINKNKEPISENKEISSQNNVIQISNNYNLVDNINKQISSENNNNESSNLSLQEKVKIIEEQNKILIKKIESYEEKMEKLKDSFQNKIDILDSKIGMICYRDLIKDLINYSFNFFKCPEDKNIKLWKKVKSIKKTIMSSKNIIELLNFNERKALSNFIQISFLALENVNHNVHEGFFISNYSNEDFIQCFQNHMDLYDVELVKRRKKDKLDIPNVKTIKTILNKIGFIDGDDFFNDDDFSNYSEFIEDEVSSK